MRSMITSVLSFMTLLALLSGCTTNEATGRAQLNYLTRDQEIELGEEAMPQLVDEYGGTVSDTTLRDYVVRVGRSMVPHTEGYGPDLPWEFTLLDSDVINAFALPGGKVFISRELMYQMTNEAQLAGVLGHEIGHVTAQHVDERLGQALGVSVLAAILTGATRDKDYSKLVGVMVGVSGQGFLLKFGRDQESEADRLGMRYMRKAGYDPIGQLQVMEILEEAMRGARGLPPEFFSTHPYPETRQERIRDWLRTDFARTQNNPEYQLHADRFNRVARPRLDALYSQRSRSGHRFALDQPATWCAVCQTDGIAD